MKDLKKRILTPNSVACLSLFHLVHDMVVKIAVSLCENSHINICLGNALPDSEYTGNVATLSENISRSYRRKFL